MNDYAFAGNIYAAWRGTWMLKIFEDD
jgi:hypothetical protein